MLQSTVAFGTYVRRTSRELATACLLRNLAVLSLSSPSLVLSCHVIIISGSAERVACYLFPNVSRFAMTRRAPGVLDTLHKASSPYIGYLFG